MDKETLSNYGWIVICVLVLAVMIALATPFGTFVADAVKSTTQGLFDVNQNALNSTGLINIDHQEFESCDHDYEVTTTANCTTAGTTTHTCKLCGKSYSEETPAGHTFENASDMKCDVCNTSFTAYAFTASDYDNKMGTTTKTDANVVIPITFEHNGTKYKTTSIYHGAFSGCTSLTSITIPDSVTFIGSQAFDSCYALKSIILPEGLITIDSSAFSYASLTNITIPDSVTSIGGSVFYWCRKLESVTLPDGITTIGLSTFSSCTSLKSITLPASLTTIGDTAFHGCTGLSTITFEGTVAQWQAITFGSNWNVNVPATHVQCSDGTVSLS